VRARRCKSHLLTIAKPNVRLFSDMLRISKEIEVIARITMPLIKYSIFVLNVVDGERGVHSGYSRVVNARWRPPVSSPIR
jgi:hypothetical protein